MSEHDPYKAFKENPRGHVWRLDESGEIDWYYYIDPENDIHTGPSCSQCGDGFCINCTPDGPDSDCEVRP